MYLLQVYDQGMRDEVVDWLRGRVDESSVTCVASELGLALPTLLRILARLPVQRGTVALVTAAWEAARA